MFDFIFTETLFKQKENLLWSKINFDCYGCYWVDNVFINHSDSSVKHYYIGRINGSIDVYTNYNEDKLYNNLLYLNPYGFAYFKTNENKLYIYGSQSFHNSVLYEINFFELMKKIYTSGMVDVKLVIKFLNSFKNIVEQMKVDKILETIKQNRRNRYETNYNKDYLYLSNNKKININIFTSENVEEKIDVNKYYSNLFEYFIHMTHIEKINFLF